MTFVSLCSAVHLPCLKNVMIFPVSSFIHLSVWPLIDLSLTFLVWWLLWLVMVSSPRNLSSLYPSIHLFFFHPWGYESLPQSHSSQTSSTSSGSVSDLHSCGAAQTQAKSIPAPPFLSLFLFSLSVLPSLAFLSVSPSFSHLVVFFICCLFL